MANLISPKDLIEGDIFQMLGLNNLSAEQQEETIKKLIEGVQNRVIVRIDDLISDQDRPKFHELLDKGSDEEINQFLQLKQINVPQLVAEEALLLKSEIVQAVKQTKE